MTDAYAQAASDNKYTDPGSRIDVELYEMQRNLLASIGKENEETFAIDML